MESIKKLVGIVLIGLLAVSCADDQLSDAYGQFEADEVVISAETQGRLVDFNIQEGDRLEAGFVAGLIDTTQLVLQKRELEAAKRTINTKFSNLDARQEVLRTQLETAHTELNRFQSLLRNQAATQQQIDRAAGEVNTLMRQIEAVETEKQSVDAELNQLKVRIEQVQDQIRRAQIVNPVHGTVLNKYAEQHELVAPGKPIYRIANLDEVNLRVYVSGAQLPGVIIGNEVEVLIDLNETENDRLTGTVIWVSSRAEFTPRMIQTKEERVTQVYAVKVRVENPDGRIKIGMPGEVNF
jgi:HlyD family secretion protein